MLNTTAELLRCPRSLKTKQSRGPCRGALRAVARKKLPSGTSPEIFEIWSGHLECTQCQARFPILSGVALVVEDVQGYLLSHVKGIARAVPENEIPREFLREFLEAKEEIEQEHIEEDLEAERVNALYLMNHYLRVDSEQGERSADPWWKPGSGPASPLIDSLVREHWDHGPFAQIRSWMKKLGSGRKPAVIELGCGVGGLSAVLRSEVQSYFGVDSSFASISLARHLALGVPYSEALRIPEDLLQGPVSREIQLPVPKSFDGRTDFIVADMEFPPLQEGHWDVCIALNTIDMLDDPAALPKQQRQLLGKEGIAIQSCPYIWHERIARDLRKKVPRDHQDTSARAVEWLYTKAGFKILERVEHLPWLFFKHVRQLEIYSVHLFTAKRQS